MGFLIARLICAVRGLPHVSLPLLSFLILSATKPMWLAEMFHLYRMTSSLPCEDTQCLLPLAWSWIITYLEHSVNALKEVASTWLKTLETVYILSAYLRSCPNFAFSHMLNQPSDWLLGRLFGASDGPTKWSVAIRGASINASQANGVEFVSMNVLKLGQRVNQMWMTMSHFWKQPCWGFRGDLPAADSSACTGHSAKLQVCWLWESSRLVFWHSVPRGCHLRQSWLPPWGKSYAI